MNGYMRNLLVIVMKQDGFTAHNGRTVEADRVTPQITFLEVTPISFTSKAF